MKALITFFFRISIVISLLGEIVLGRNNTNSSQTVTEWLNLLPLDHPTNNFIFINFKQIIKIKHEDSASRHLKQFPSAIQQLFLSNPDLQSFTASLSQGQWRSKSWGAIPIGELLESGGIVTAVVNTLHWNQR